ncbi:glycoside hydrolase family 13 protein [Cellulomonas sp. PhB143]|uniref:glycoside hydrolase family 13 protein n=1 Tax=Cellulomonas sp. PhB143 TaxID=2485186 RepID=UPI000F493DA5|nr:glycoside hydrolase family 13 protein [Cellulomonas sp. PhB143]ROS75354.1 alpha-glucosidase [Cellulomonas sp. PhB143]
MTTLDRTPPAPARTATEWWRHAVIYQVYPRSFADADGDGVGDLRGITGRLPALRDLGVDAVWLSPFFTSPQRDAGYDVSDYCDVDPVFGTLADFDALLRAAHGLGLRVVVDLVPNHTSTEHAWFRAALAAPEGSAERGHYVFRDGTGPGGDLPPNNWQSVFGGPAWSRVAHPDGTPGQWYLHLFDSSQPDLDWQDPWVREQFRDVLRFWLDRGVDGFRIDVAHGMVKAPGLPDHVPAPDAGSMGGDAGQDTPPYWAQEGVHEIFRDWRELVETYDGERALCGEAWVTPMSRLARYVRPDELHQTFNFAYLETPWSAPALRAVVDGSLASFAAVGAPSTWVLSNHDVVRHASRLALTFDNPQGAGIGPASPALPDEQLGLRRARAASALMLALPGSAYVYQGEELGLPEAVDLPDDARQDPTWFRTGGERYGRDGCRVPLPWEADAPGFGFGPTGASWLPQPAGWSRLARDVQAADPASTLNLYRTLLAARAARGLGTGAVEWLDGWPDDVVALRNGDVTVVANLGDGVVPLPDGALLAASGPLAGGGVPTDTTVWVAARG